MTPKEGLIVTVSPSASAFFAGELFHCTITFSNPAPKIAATSSSHPAPPLAPSASTSSLLPPGRRRPPSASHLSLAEQDPRGYNADDLPASPFINNRVSSDSWGSAPNLHSRSSSMASTVRASSGNGPTSTSPLKHHQKRPSFSANPNTGSFGNEPVSAASSTPPWLLAHRSVSGLGNNQLPSSPTGSAPMTSAAILPTRKGLIGKPIPAPSTSSSTSLARGIYASGPRRPTGPGAAKHGRALSMAVSSPNLSMLNGSPTPPLATQPYDRNYQLPNDNDASSPPKSPIHDGSLPPSQHSMSSNLGPGMRRPSSNPTSNPTYPYPHPRNTRTDPHDSDSGSDYDPNESRTSLPGQGFYGMGKNETMDNLVKRDLQEAYTREVSNSLPPSASNMRLLSIVVPPPPKSGSFTYPKDTISLLWSFAHLEGTFEVDEELIKPNEFQLLKQELTSGPSAAVGGGTLDESLGKKSTGGGGWGAWLFGSSQSSANGLSKINGADIGMGQAGDLGERPRTLEERKEKSLKEKTIPTFSSPPSILGVDAVLEPGESKSYTFSIRIPADLPPSFRGKSIKFAYHLVVGTNRTKIGGSRMGGATTRDAASRVIKVPVRVYNHVGVTGARPFYDLTNPIVYHRDEATVLPISAPANPPLALAPAVISTKFIPDSVTDQTKILRKASSGRRDFEAYATTLLDSVRLSSPELVAKASMSPTLQPLQSPTAVQMEGLPAYRPERTDRHAGGNGSKANEAQGAPHTGALASGAGLIQDEEETAGCKAAVEIVTRNSQKVSYDINKDGFMVAQLTLVKSAYRLGETVNGSVIINSSEGRVLRISARLETHELIETSISTKPSPHIRAITRRLHSEHHEMTLDSARVGFALAIPSGATPDFGTSGVKLQWSVRLSFLVVPPSPDAPHPNAGGQNGPPRRTSILGRLPTSAPAPPSTTGSNGSRSHTRSKSFAYGFEPAVALTLPAPPAILPTGAAHLMPVLGPRDTSSSHVSYRAVPDLGFAPVLYSSSAPEPPPAPGPLQRSASGKGFGHTKGAASLSASPRGMQTVAVQQTSVVLVPAKTEMVECAIPIKVYPGNTPFRPTTSVFAA